MAQSLTGKNFLSLASKTENFSTFADGPVPSVMVTLPAWAVELMNDPGSDLLTRRFRSDEEMMSLAIHLSDRNISEGTGGPFGSAIFERHAPAADEPGGYCTLVSIGMNRVVPLGNCTLHGEMVAIQLAQRKVGSYTLRVNADGGDGSENDEGLFWDESAEDGGDGDDPAAGGARCDRVEDRRRFELFTSCEPCAMCLGATLWSGASRIVCGAGKEDARAIGFDEGPVFEESYAHLERAGVGVTRRVLGREAAAVLRRYGESGGIYSR